MKIPKIVIALTILLFVCCILFVRIQLGSYSLFHLFIFPVFFISILFPNNTFSKSFLTLDKISISICVFIIIAFSSYLVNMSDAKLVSDTYSSNSMESPTFLYGKIMINGLIFLLSTLVAYQLGKAISQNKEMLFKIYNVLIKLCLLNAFVNVVAWLITTGGKIDRYNFEPPLTFSPGVSIQYSSMGFLLGLAALFAIKSSSKRLFYKLGLAVLLLSILIILTRQSQLSFVIACIWYYLKTNRIGIKSVVALSFLSVLAISILFFVVSNTEIFESYDNIGSADSADVAVRLLMLNSAYDMFISHPFFGVGYGMFVGHNTVPVFTTGVPSYLASPHNGLAAILSELGAIGTIAFIFINIFVIRAMSRKIKKIKDEKVYRYCSAIFVFQVILLLSAAVSNSNLFGPPSETPYLYIAFISWFMIGSVLGVTGSID